MRTKDTRPCHGCDSDYYNGNNARGIEECWLLETARRVRRFKIAWWTQPTVDGAFEEVETYQCHTETGRFAFESQLPSSAVNPRRLTVLEGA